MSGSDAPLEGPDLSKGIAFADLADGAMLLGHAAGEAVLLARRGEAVFAIGAVCTHYGGPLNEGLLVGETVRCPWHHACFSLRTGAPLRPPALDPVDCFNVERVGETVFVREKLKIAATPARSAETHPASVVIVGGGAAGNAAAETLRRGGFGGRVLMLSADLTRPVDRPNLSKGFLSGAADAASNPLRPAAFYAEHDIELRLDSRVKAIDVAGRTVEMEDGARLPYGALLLATGATPVRLDLPGTELPHVHYLRSQLDGEALAAAAAGAKRAVVIGASFIGLEVAASLRTRGVGVAVVAPEAVPMEKVLGKEVGTFIRGVHEKRGVTFHLGTTAVSIDAHHVTLKNGETLEADLVVIGVGVRPAIELAKAAGLAIDRGVTVDEFLRTSAPGIWAAGDIARWPDPLSVQAIRVEHWVVAERLGQAAARNILGAREHFEAVPFFWTEQYDLAIAYIGHAESFDDVRIDGALGTDATVTYSLGGKRLAVAEFHRDLAGLKAERAFEEVMGAP
ncbi:MAG: FAD-dependent oxidoreductase [Pseudomonadota bacterium]|nr:FAD-dependent oxidoreductase [Pseudomonadota bacterium]